MDSATRSHFYSAIERTAIVDEPFPYLNATNVFPSEFYARLQSSLPSIDHYKQYNARYSARYALDLTRSSVQGLGEVSPFWTEFEDWLNSSELMNVMMRKFGDRMKICYTERSKFLNEAKTADGVTISPQSLLCRDFSNFAIDPHTDAGPKLVVGIFYFPKDESLIEFGTSLYTAKDPTLRDFYKSTRFDRAGFDLHKTFENRPNSFVAFLKTDQSFHGVEERPYSNVGRDVLFWIPRIGKAKNAETTFTLPASIFTPEQEAVVA